MLLGLDLLVSAMGKEMSRCGAGCVLLLLLLWQFLSHRDWWPHSPAVTASSISPPACSAAACLCLLFLAPELLSCCYLSI
jgi:hypothetical protein